MENIKKLNGWLWERHHRTISLLTMKDMRNAIPENNTSTPGHAERQTPPPFKTYNKKQFIGLFLGPILFFIVMFGLPLEGLSNDGRGVFATITLVATWWILEVMPLGITSLLPIVLLPLLSNVTGKEAASS